MRPESEKLLRDILDCAQTIDAYVRDKTAEDYEKLRWLRDCVQWNFTVIGEAVSGLHRIDPAIAERIDEWDRIVGFRNQLVHGYGVIQNPITWSIIQRKLPVLVRDVEELLKS